MLSPTSSPSLNDDREPVDFEALLQKLDTEFAASPSDLIKKFTCDLNGVVFDIRRIAHEKKFRFIITAVLGYLPFSIESTERRQAIQTIVTATKSLPRVQFAIDYASKIRVSGLFEVLPSREADFFFYPLTLFLQEARPFMQLIGAYL